MIDSRPLSPPVSIIVPTYNYGSLISQTLESLLNQSYKNWECWVVDDGSTDNTSEVVEEYCNSDPRFKYLPQSNRGPGAARNDGIRLSRGAYIQFLDADDLLEKRKIEHHVDFLEENPEVDLVYGGVRYFKTGFPDERRYSMLEKDAPWMPEISGRGTNILKILLRDNIMVTSAPLLRRKTIEDVGYFDPNLPHLEDWDYWIRCAYLDKHFHYLDREETLSLVRWHPNSTSQNRSKMREYEVLVHRKYNKLLVDIEMRKLNAELLIAIHYDDGVKDVKAGRLKKGVGKFLRAAIDSPGIITKLKWCYWAALTPLIPRHLIKDLLYSSPLQAASLVLRSRLKLAAGKQRPRK